MARAEAAHLQQAVEQTPQIRRVRKRSKPGCCGSMAYHAGRHTARQAPPRAHTHTHIEAGRQTEGQTGRRTKAHAQTGSPAHTLTGRQEDRQIGRPTGM